MKEEKIVTEKLLGGKLKYARAPILNDIQSSLFLLNLQSDKRPMGIFITTFEVQGAKALLEKLMQTDILKEAQAHPLNKTEKPYTFCFSVPLEKQKSFEGFSLIQYGTESFFIFFDRKAEIDLNKISLLFSAKERSQSGAKWIEWVINSIEGLNASCICSTDPDCSVLEFVGKPKVIDEIISAI